MKMLLMFFCLYSLLSASPITLNDDPTNFASKSKLRHLNKRELVWPFGSPKTVGRFEIQAILGKGSFGIVYKALDTKTNEVVALKAVRNHFTLKNREASIVKMLGRSKGDPFLSLGVLYIPQQLIEGKSLFMELRDPKYKADRAAVNLLLKKCYGELSALHQTGYFHGDPHSANFMIDSFGGITLIDFGKSTPFRTKDDVNEYLFIRNDVKRVVGK